MAVWNSGTHGQRCFFGVPEDPRLTERVLSGSDGNPPGSVRQLNVGNTCLGCEKRLVSARYLIDDGPIASNPWLGRVFLLLTIVFGLVHALVANRNRCADRFVFQRPIPHGTGSSVMG